MCEYYDQILEFGYLLLNCDEQINEKLKDSVRVYQQFLLMFISRQYINRRMRTQNLRISRPKKAIADAQSSPDNPSHSSKPKLSVKELKFDRNNTPQERLHLQKQNHHKERPSGLLDKNSMLESIISEFPTYIYKNSKNEKVIERMSISKMKELINVKNLNTGQICLKTTVKPSHFRKSEIYSIEEDSKKEEKETTWGQTLIKRKKTSRVEKTQSRRHPQKSIFSTIAKMEEETPAAGRTTRRISPQISSSMNFKETQVFSITPETERSLHSSYIDKFKRKLLKYLGKIKENCEKSHISSHVVQRYSGGGVKYFLDMGNNAKMISDLLRKRWWWSPGQLQDDLYSRKINLVWSQLKNEEFYTMANITTLSSYQPLNIGAANSSIVVHNHLNNSEYLCNQAILLAKMEKYVEFSKKQSPLPPIIHIMDIKQSNWKKFMRKVEYGTLSKTSEQAVFNRARWVIKSVDRKGTNSLKILANQAEIQQYLKSDYKNGFSYLLQPYIESYLFKQRKFDIRIYLLVTKLGKAIKGYFYKDGVISFATEIYNDNHNNPYVHLTSDAIQINHNEYGELTESNKISFEDFQVELDETEGNRSFAAEVLPKLKESSRTLLYAVSSAWRQNGENPAFQLFQLKFLLDKDFEPWLISVHRNPCLETTCPLLEAIFPRMIDSTFKLTIDLLFPPPTEWPLSKMHLLSSKLDQNSFELIFDGEQSFCLPVDCFSSLSSIQDETKVFEDIREDVPYFLQKELTPSGFFTEFVPLPR